MKRLADLSDAGRNELALALLLWKDFKADGKFDPDILMQAYELADMLGVKSHFEQLIRTIPTSFKIKLDV